MSLAQMLYKETGKKTGVVYATGMIKGWEVRRIIRGLPGTKQFRQLCSNQFMTNISKSINNS
ncbi:hypothetical protein P7H19_17230 [Paenibacillus larvae]|nr:hypothetical protein [Paenibacillus larvae]MDT2237666.1 hypothetical protein [Paenibacillus larvae]